MNGSGLVALFVGAAALVMAVVAWVFTSALVATWDHTLTVVVVVFVGVMGIIMAVNVGAGARLALQDRHEHKRPVVIQHAPQNPAGFLADPLRDAERLARIESTYSRMGAARENGTVPAFQTGPWVDYDDDA